MRAITRTNLPMSRVMMQAHRPNAVVSAAALPSDPTTTPLNVTNDSDVSLSESVGPIIGNQLRRKIVTEGF